MRSAAHEPNAKSWHVITCEYPPRLGGVSDYTHLLAEQLATTGDEVHIWGPEGSAGMPHSRVMVHDEAGRFRASDLRRTSTGLNAFGPGRKILVQWVPHGYGYKGLNLAFCAWLLQRALLHADDIEIMAHECFLSFGEGGWRHNLAAFVQRIMSLLVLLAANRVWVSTPIWGRRLRALAFGRNLKFDWLPVPSNVPVSRDLEAIRRVRNKYAPNGETIVGHFGTHNPLVVRLLKNCLTALANSSDETIILLIGEGGNRLRSELVQEHPSLESSIRATGVLDGPDLSHHLSSCDLMLQPYVDGISARRGSVMAALAHGRPVITTKERATEPVWEESGAVILTPAGDEAAMLRSALDLIGNPNRRRALGAAAAQLYTQAFDIQHTVSKLRGGADRNGVALHIDILHQQKT